MKKPVPTLSASGFVTDISGKADRLMAYFLLSEYSQSTTYIGQISSLNWLVAQYGNEPLKLARLVSETLEDLFNSYFESSQVDVTTNEEEQPRYTLSISAHIFDEGKHYDLAREISVINSKTAAVFEVLNGDA